MENQILVSELSMVELESMLQEKSERKIELESLLKRVDYKNLKNGEAERAGVELPYDPVELHKINQAMRDELDEIEGLLPQAKSRLKELAAQVQVHEEE